MLVRHEVQEGMATVLAMVVRIERGQQGRTPLYAHSKVEGAAQPPILSPAVELGQAQVFLGFGDRFAADAREDEFVPELIEFGELFVFPRLFTW
jgi:hypothetical protein